LALFVGSWAGIIHAGEIDTGKWGQVRPGMTQTDVLRIMGEPEHRNRGRNNAWDYGEIVPEGPAFPTGLAFRVWFNRENVVTSLESPFGKQPPRRGLPEAPQIFLPQSNAKLAHYPRLLDIRWYPVTGSYPMSYEVQSENGIVQTNGTTSFFFSGDTFKTAVPHLSLQFSGGQPGRVRVRAINAEGAGPWSEYTVFIFAR
jgi:hypothetical protein